MDGREFDERGTIQGDFDGELEEANDATSSRMLIINILERTNTLQIKLAELRYLSNDSAHRQRKRLQIHRFLAHARNWLKNIPSCRKS